MATVEYVPVEEMLPASALRKESQRRQVRSEYEGYIDKLTPGQAGKLQLEKGDKFSTLRDRLRSAARRLDKKIQIRRRGDTVFFRLKDADAPEDGEQPEVEQAIILPAEVAAPRRRATKRVSA